jgi:pilus assembly protein CpaE
MTGEASVKSMSEGVSQATSILLPASSIAVYSKDSATLEAARNLENDWRFARVEIYTEEGHVQTAIENYQEAHSPDLILIQTDTIDSGFTDKLGELASFCEEGTSAIVIGPDNDVNLYRRLIDMGVSDYLVRPINSAMLGEVVAKSLIEKVGATGSRLIAFLGAKGGVGASILAEATACGAADILGQKTLLLDTAGGWSTFSVGMGFEPATTMAQAVRAAQAGDQDGLKRMLHKVSDKLSVLATGSESMLDKPVDPEQLEHLIDVLMVEYPVVIADLSQSAEQLQRAMVARANQIMLVSAPTLPSLRLARTLMHEVKSVRGGQNEGIELIINMQGMSAGSEVSNTDIEAAMECKPSAFLPFDPKMFLANENESRKLTDDKNARALIEKTLMPIISKVLDLDTKVDKGAEKAKGGILDGFLGKLKAK